MTFTINIDTISEPAWGRKPIETEERLICRKELESFLLMENKNDFVTGLVEGPETVCWNLSQCCKFWRGMSFVKWPLSVFRIIRLAFRRWLWLLLVLYWPNALVCFITIIIMMIRNESRKEETLVWDDDKMVRFIVSIYQTNGEKRLTIIWF